MAHCVAVACTRVVLLHHCFALTAMRLDIEFTQLFACEEGRQPNVSKNAICLDSCWGSVMGWGSRYNTPLVIELKACIKQCSVLIRVFDLYVSLCSGDNACYAIYKCDQLFASIALGGGLLFVARRQMAGKLPASFAMDAQADQQTESRVVHHGVVTLVGSR